jgi:hypothetical protein
MDTTAKRSAEQGLSQKLGFGQSSSITETFFASSKPILAKSFGISVAGAHITRAREASQVS